eukprot:2128285-Prymnesium_polylepis.1
MAYDAPCGGIGRYARPAVRGWHELSSCVTHPHTSTRASHTNARHPEPATCMNHAIDYDF